MASIVLFDFTWPHLTTPILIAQHGDTNAFACARQGQPPRFDYRRHRHRQDHHPADLAEGFLARRAGFLADIKGRLDGHFANAANRLRKLDQMLAEATAARRAYQAFPTTLWDVFGEQGHPVRATVSDLGPLLLARMLNLNETQTGVLQLVFKIADDDGLLLLDLKDLRAMCQDVGDNASQYTTQYGNISAASIGGHPARIDADRTARR